MTFTEAKSRIDTALIALGLNDIHGQPLLANEAFAALANFHGEDFDRVSGAILGTGPDFEQYLKTMLNMIDQYGRHLQMLRVEKNMIEIRKALATKHDGVDE